MSSVSRRDVPLSSTDLSVPETPSSPRAPSPARMPSGAGPRNQLEPYRESESPPSREPPAPKGAEPGLTAGRLALGGARDREALQADAAWADLEKLLRTDWKDWSITHADRRQVHERLERLPDAAYRRTLARMEEAGLLARYLEPEAMGEPAVRAFLNQAARKGVVSREPPLPAPSAAASPPAGPVFHGNDAALPESLRRVIHGANLEAKRAYVEAHEAYVRRYTEEVGRKGSPLELRELGPPVSPFSLSEPGVTASHPDARALRASWARVSVPDATARAYEAVAARLQTLASRRQAGTLQVRQEVEAAVGRGEARVKTSREDTLTLQGTHTGTPKEGVELGAHGVKAEVMRDASGALQTKGSLDLGGGGVSADSEGKVRLELAVPGHRGVGAYAEFNSREGTFGGGVSVEREVPGARARVEYGVTLQGARPERAGDIASREPGTVFGPLPELERGVAWEALPAGRRERMVRDGWSAGSWAQALERRRP